MWRTDSLEKTLILGKMEVSRRRWWQRMRWLDGITDSMDMSLSKLRYREAWHAVVLRVTKSWTWLSDWTELNWTPVILNTPVQLLGLHKHNTYTFRTSLILLLKFYSLWILAKCLNHPSHLLKVVFLITMLERLFAIIMYFSCSLHNARHCTIFKWIKEDHLGILLNISIIRLHPQRLWIIVWCWI